MINIAERVSYITDQAEKLVQKHTSPFEIGDLDYAAFFPQGPEEHEDLIRALEALGEIEIKAPSPTVYHLEKPIETPQGILNLIRVRRFDPKKLKWRGYADFALTGDYEGFRKRHEEDRNHFGELVLPHGKLVELRDPKFDVMAYFPKDTLSQDLGIK